MIKAIFWIGIFFFFIAVLFYGIRYIFMSLSKLFQDQDHPRYQQQNNLPTKPSHVSLSSHYITFYNPTLDCEVNSYGEVIKCYREHDKLWIKFQSQEDNSIKTISIDHISAIENLKTKESKYQTAQIVEYFNRFI